MIGRTISTHMQTNRWSDWAQVWWVQSLWWHPRPDYPRSTREFDCQPDEPLASFSGDHQQSHQCLRFPSCYIFTHMLSLIVCILLGIKLLIIITIMLNPSSELTVTNLYWVCDVVRLNYWHQRYPAKVFILHGIKPVSVLAEHGSILVPKISFRPR